jgi:hypothetical protein
MRVLLLNNESREDAGRSALSVIPDNCQNFLGGTEENHRKLQAA